MTNPNGPIIDMTRSGDFVQPARPGFGTIVARLAALGVLLLVAALAFWAALFIVPVLLVLGVIGYFVFRQQVKRGNVVVMRRF
jgi:uncharacterized BrkB/YihY/UPF0761 family membrane protein